MVKTPSRSSLSLPTSVPLPPSPAAVTDAIDRQTTKIRKRVSGIYSESGIHETSESFRHVLSSPIAINIIALIIEAYGLRQEILPGGIAGFVPAIPYLTNSKTFVYLPNLFLLLDTRFWAPFSLWVTTSMLLPLLCAYFVVARPASRQRPRTNLILLSTILQKRSSHTLCTRNLPLC
jgi:hypothetical protein